MSLPLNWMVLLFFILNASILFIIFVLNSKFKWRMITNELEAEVERLNKKLSTSPSIEKDFAEALEDIKEKLNTRQFEIFMLNFEGYSSKEIAEKINLSPNTINSHIKVICKNLGVKKRSQLGNVFFDRLKEKIGLESLLEI